MRYLIVPWLGLLAQVQTDDGRERARITALEKRVTELERAAVRGADMWIETAPGRFVCRIPGGCSEHWRAPVSGRR